MLTYEVTDGPEVYGTFSSQSKADAFKKELKSQGVKARVRIVHEDTKAKKTEKAPKKPVKAKKATKSIPVPKKTAKAPQKPKEAPKTGKGGNADNVPKDYKGPLITDERIAEVFDDRTPCIDLSDGRPVMVRVVDRTVSLIDVNVRHNLLKVYLDADTESDGKYLKVVSNGECHWFLISGGLDASAPEKRLKVDYATCSLDQLADVLYEIQEVHVSHRMWYDRENSQRANPVWTRDGIREAMWNPEATAELCDVFLHCFITTCSEHWGGWDEDSISYADWKAIEKILIRMRDISIREIEANEAKTTPAPAEKPKKGPFKKKTKTQLEVRADLYKRLGNIMSAFGSDAIPVSRAQFDLMNPDHTAMIRFTSADGSRTSFFGLPDEPESNKTIRLSEVAANIGSYFDADGNPIPARLKADATGEYANIRRQQLNWHGMYRVNADDFRKSINRATKVIGKGRFRKTEGRMDSGRKDVVCFYDDGYENLIMLSESEAKGEDGRSQYGVLSDVGDGCDLTGPVCYQADLLRIAADLMALSEDSVCRVNLDEKYPMMVQLNIGGFGVDMIIAPCGIVE